MSTEPDRHFSMERGRIVPPGSPDWFRTVSFGDVIKIGGFLIGGVMMFVRLESSVATVVSDLQHETELRRMLENSTAGLVADIRANQRDNSARFDKRFEESAARDKELIGEIRSHLDRLESKVDHLNDTQQQGRAR